MKTFDKKNYRKSFLVGILFCLCLSAGCASNVEKDQSTQNDSLEENSASAEGFDKNFIYYQTPLQIGSSKLKIAVADSPAEQEQGLSDRIKLAENEGMLFDFRGTEITRPGFWMQRMQFDLDIIWIKNNHVIGIAKNVPHPKTEREDLPLYSPPSDIDMVLEVLSGFTEKNKIEIGDQIN